MTDDDPDFLPEDMLIAAAFQAMRAAAIGDDRVLVSTLQTANSAHPAAAEYIVQALCAAFYAHAGARSPEEMDRLRVGMDELTDVDTGMTLPINHPDVPAPARWCAHVLSAFPAADADLWVRTLNDAPVKDRALYLVQLVRTVATTLHNLPAGWGLPGASQPPRPHTSN